MLRSLLLAILLQPFAFAQSTFHLLPNDVVVFYGDSITDQRMYTVLVETFVRTRFPQSNVKFVHSGWGGDRVTGGGGGAIDERLNRDVLRYNPTVMTIMLGMNDGRYRAFDQSIFDTYTRGFEHIVDVMKRQAPQARLTFIQPSPFDDTTYEPRFPGGYNSVLLRYSDYLKTLAAASKATLADLNTPVVAMLARAKQMDAVEAQKIIPDRIHPGWGGHLIMAEALLKSWMAPALVTNVDIDGEAGRLITAEKTAVSGFSANAEGLRWTQKDEALPMPLPMPANLPGLALAVKASDFHDALNRQILRVRGAKAAKYELKINGGVVGEFTAAQLNEGINLATMATPMIKQAREVHALTIKRTNIHNLRWRNLETVLGTENLGSLASTMQNLDELRDELEARQKAAAIPVTTNYSLVAQ